MPRFILGLLPLAASLAVVLTGCMLGPVDGQTVAGTSSVIHFEGYMPDPNEPVQVQELDSLGVPHFVANTMAAATPMQYDGTDMYKWSVDARVREWIPGTSGHVAKVRAVWSASRSNTAFTFTSNWPACLSSNPNIEDFITNCQSPRSPNAFIYTSDYPTSVDLSVFDIRPAVGGGLQVLVRNGGRPGRITKVVCRRSGDLRTISVNMTINPVETLAVPGINLGVSTGQTVACNVFGVNEDGSAEADPLNNPYIKTF